MSGHILEIAPPPADERLAYGPHPLQFGDLRLPPGDGPHPVVVYIHGGFWRSRYDLAHAGHVCAALTAAGIATWNVEYRRVGNGGGWPETLLDVAAAADHMRALAPRYGLDLDRLAVAGHSAGGHLALWLAARPLLPEDSPLFIANPLPVRSAVAIAGVSDLCLCWEMGLGAGAVDAFLGGSPKDLPERYDAASPAELLPLGVPQVLIHGTADDSVPYAMSVSYAQRAAEAGDEVELLTLEGVDHFAPVDPRSEVWSTVLAACVLTLIPPTPFSHAVQEKGE